MSDVAIRLDDVSKYYKLYESARDRLREAINIFGRVYHKKHYASKNINLEVRKGEILGIVGKNGSGKSTLLKLISGVLTPNDGKVTINGKISALLELGAGLNPEFTGIQNIYFYGTILGLPKSEMEGKLEEIAAFADIGDFMNQQLKTYSSGMKSRLGFALAVSINPDILIVDEVLAVGDLLFKRKCYNKINELFSDGKTVIFVSHSSQSIIQFCSRAILIEDGKVVGDGEPKDIVSQYEKSLFSSASKSYGHKDVVVGRNITQEHKHLEILDSQSMQTNEHLAKIFEYCIYDSEGDVVNVLDRDAYYTVEYKVKYYSPAKSISLGVQIKNMKGLLISGVNSWDYQKELVSHVSRIEVLKVRCGFKCSLVPGVYAVTLSASSGSEDELVKFPDALIFKVRPGGKINGGLVGMEQNIVVEKIENYVIKEVGN